MSPLDPRSDDATRINDALRSWRQGDGVLGELLFVHYADTRAPLTRAARELAEMDQAEGEPPGQKPVGRTERGLVVLTQTCDIRRACDERHYVEVAPLVEVSDGNLDMIRKGWRPAYAYVPGIASHRLVADLDRTMTVEKSIVAGWSRVTGCRDDKEARAFARALARKRARPALPDDFNALVKKLAQRIRDQHGKDSPEGRMLQALGEIRVRAAPSWDDARVQLLFWFIKSDDPVPADPPAWNKQRDRWLALVTPAGRFTRIDGVVARLDDVTARDLEESDPLDLDYLSQSTSS